MQHDDHRLLLTLLVVMLFRRPLTYGYENAALAGQHGKILFFQKNFDRLRRYFFSSLCLVRASLRSPDAAKLAYLT
jgi:hypothetical protein